MFVVQLKTLQTDMNLTVNLTNSWKQYRFLKALRLNILDRYHIKDKYLPFKLGWTSIALISFSKNVYKTCLVLQLLGIEICFQSKVHA